MITLEDNVTLSDEESFNTVILLWMDSVEEYQYDGGSINLDLLNKKAGLYYHKNSLCYQYYIVKEDCSVLSITIIYNDQGKKDYKIMEMTIKILREDGRSWNYISNYLIEFSSIINL